MMGKLALSLPCSNGLSEYARSSADEWNSSARDQGTAATL